MFHTLRTANNERIVTAPNPATNTFRLLNLDVDDVQQVLVILTDISGRSVRSYQQINQTEFDVSGLNNGLYIVNVWKGENRIHTSKLSVLK